MMRIFIAIALLTTIAIPSAAADPEDPVEYGTSPPYVKVTAAGACVTVTPEAFPFVDVRPTC